MTIYKMGLIDIYSSYPWGYLRGQIGTTEMENSLKHYADTRIMK